MLAKQPQYHGFTRYDVSAKPAKPLLLARPDAQAQHQSQNSNHPYPLKKNSCSHHNIPEDSYIVQRAKMMVSTGVEPATLALSLFG